MKQAIGLLYADYKNRLNLDSFFEAMNMVGGNEQKASIFLAMKLENRQDCWFELQLDTKLELLDIE